MENGQEGKPRIWLVLSDKVGDNAQAEIIAKTLGLPYEIKRVIPVKKYVFGKPSFKPSLFHIDQARSDNLEPPWPDLMITVGRRSSMVALWIKQQSGNRTRIVLLGRPRRWLEQFDLVVTPIQYRVPVRDNVVHLGIPFIQPDKARMEAAETIWKPRFAAMRPPIIALLVGGPTRPFILDEKVMTGLLQRAGELAAKLDGSLYITTSRRTPPRVTKVIRESMPAGSRLFSWGDKAEDNPYQGLLALGDYFIVTGDSMSMMVEVARLRKPLAIFPLPSHWWGRHWQNFTTLLHPSLHGEKSSTVLEPLGELLYRLGWVGYSRDLTMVHRFLMDSGLACRLGEEFPKQGTAIPDELGLVVKRVRALLDN